MESEQPLCPECDFSWQDERDKAGETTLDDGTPLVYLTKYRPNTVTHSLVWRGKTQQLKRRADFLASQLAEVLAEAGMDCCDVIITHVPRSASKRRETGVDQSKALGQALAAFMGGVHRDLFSHHSRVQQKSLSDPAMRLENARKAYSIMKSCKHIAGKKILLLDDVVTSGASMIVCADLLRQAGAMEVICVAVARAKK